MAGLFIIYFGPPKWGFWGIWANIFDSKKLQFIHKLTANDISNTAKSTKRWYYSAAQWHLGDVLVGNITVQALPCSLWSSVYHVYIT